MNYIEKIRALAAKHQLGFVYNPGGGQFLNLERSIDIQISTMDDEEDYHKLLMTLQDSGLEPKESNKEDSQCDRFAVEPAPSTTIERRITRDRDETGDYVIIHVTPVPAIEPATVNELADLAHELRKTAGYLQGGCGWARSLEALERAATLIESNALQRFVPVPVSEKPWEREGWCDARGRCWVWSAGNCHWWELIDSRLISFSHDDYTHCLPYQAITPPATTEAP